MTEKLADLYGHMFNLFNMIFITMPCQGSFPVCWISQQLCISGGEGSLANEQLLRPAHSVPRDREEVQWWLPRRVRLLCCHRHLQAQGENIVEEDLEQS